MKYNIFDKVIMVFKCLFVCQCMMIVILLIHKCYLFEIYFKVMHDCLNTATNLFRQFDVKMCNVFDTTVST